MKILSIHTDHAATGQIAINVAVETAPGFYTAVRGVKSDLSNYNIRRVVEEAKPLDQAVAESIFTTLPAGYEFVKATGEPVTAESSRLDRLSDLYEECKDIAYKMSGETITPGHPLQDGLFRILAQIRDLTAPVLAASEK